MAGVPKVFRPEHPGNELRIDAPGEPFAIEVASTFIPSAGKAGVSKAIAQSLCCRPLDTRLQALPEVKRCHLNESESAP